MYCEYGVRNAKGATDKCFNRALCIVNIHTTDSGRRVVVVLIEHYVLWIFNCNGKAMDKNSVLIEHYVLWIS